jgi:glutamate-5-semialdehyde dehydrogenase
MDMHEHIEQLCHRARSASAIVAALTTADKDRLLRVMADTLEAGGPAVLRANEQDLVAAVEDGLSPAMIDRLRLTPDRLAATAAGVRQVADLPDPVGRELDRLARPNGLVIRKMSVPLGVIAVIYESRPNVTADAAALCFKAGNAVILRGGREARESNRAILEAMLAGGRQAGLPEHALQLVGFTDRAAVRQLLQMDQLVDLVIPRGGESLIRAVAENARVPVLKHYTGICHVYVDRAADPEMAGRIAVNAKCQRPGVCNAMETLLVHRELAGSFLPAVAGELERRGVELRGDDDTRRLVPGARAAIEEDWTTEYLDLILSVRVVDDLEQAIDHINRYGSHHSDVIVTGDRAAADRFTAAVDSATVYVNASSRFTDGFEFGKGAEIGISTDKLHARGPCGVEELTTYKYVIEGDGQVRE